MDAASQTWIIREKRASASVPILLGASGALTLASGGCALALAVVFAPDVGAASESVNFARWFTGKLGFAAAGIALIIAARYQWTVGGQLRIVAPFSALAGVAMQFIWVDSAAILHPIIGTAFFIWLLAVGAMLATGRTERLFIRLLSASSARPRREDELGGDEVSAYLRQRVRGYASPKSGGMGRANGVPQPSGFPLSRE